MTRELLLARRLLEAVADSDASPAAADEAAAEFAELSARLDVASGRGLPVDTFEGMRAADLSPSAWLLLLDNRGEGDRQIPPEILDELFLECSDAAFRFRLVNGALGHPSTRARYAAALAEDPLPESIEALPDSWPKSRIQLLQRTADIEVTGEATRQALLEFIMYLLQDGSEAALALAAAAIVPDEAWREPARSLVRNIVLRLDPGRTGYGRAFGRLRLGG